jgi:hypothetical protein
LLEVRSLSAAVRDRERHPWLRLAGWAGVACSTGVLVASYAAIAVYSSEAWLWPVIVHESGDRTLARTIFYYEHAARELPLDLLLGAVVGGAARFVYPGTAPRRSGRLAVLALLAAGVAALIVGGTLWVGGPALLRENILQFPTRPGEALAWGGHWRYHLLSQAMLLLTAFGLAAPALFLAGGNRRGGRRGLRIVGASLGLFLGLSVVFVPGVESFRDPVVLGHQAREVMTHALVTVPMAWGVCLLLARGVPGRAAGATVSVAVPALASGAGVAITLYLQVASLATGATAEGQSESLAVLVFPHFFEHTFSYALASLTAGAVFEWSAGPERQGGSGASLA